MVTDYVAQTNLSLEQRIKKKIITPSPWRLITLRTFWRGIFRPHVLPTHSPSPAFQTLRVFFENIVRKCIWDLSK